MFPVSVSNGCDDDDDNDDDNDNGGEWPKATIGGRRPPVWGPKGPSRPQGLERGPRSGPNF